MATTSIVVEPEGQGGRRLHIRRRHDPTQGSDDTLRDHDHRRKARPAEADHGRMPSSSPSRSSSKIGRRQGDLVRDRLRAKPGQTVVTSGQNKLANNAPVTINNEANPAAVALDGGDGKS